MRLFKRDPNKLMLGFNVLQLKDGDLIFMSTSASRFRVRLADIETVAVTSSPGGGLRQVLQIIGRGTILASTTLPLLQAEIAQKFIVERLDHATV